MPTPDGDRAVYEGRVNAVIDHIEEHLDEELTLDELAGVAHFSPYHFHRIFSSLRGETVGAFVSRLRLERAGTKLVTQPDLPVTRVALDCGFADPSSFSRAFKGAYGMTPTEWRRGGHRRYATSVASPVEADAPNAEYGIERVEIIGGGTRWTVRAGSLGSTTVVVEQLSPLEVAYARYTGPYQGLADVFTDLFTRLLTWAEPRGFVGPGTPMLSVYHDDPSITAAADLRVSACVPVTPETRPDGDIGRMTIPGGACAMGTFELGDQDYAEAWHTMAGGWFPESGYEPDDRLPFERFIVGREARTPGAQVVDVCVPARPLRRY